MTPPDQPRADASPAEQVVGDMRYSRLLPRRRLRQLVTHREDGTTVEPADLLRLLQETGELTAWQVAQILAGRGRRLRLGSYVLLEPIGCGGMGQVYRARHRVMKRFVAVKIVGRRKPGADGNQTVARFRREAQAAARLCHPHVVTTHDACVERGVLFLVMELLPGSDLHRHVKETGPLPPSQVCEIARQAALALQYLHEHGLLHRDLKPSNLMLLQADNPRVKLLDMGLACLRGRRRRKQRLQGSVDFLAPERATNPPAEDTYSDLYSLGCTLYFLLMGEVPFPGDTWTEKLLQHRLDPAPDVRILCPAVPAGLAVLIDRLLAKDPADRPASAADVVHDVTTLSARPTLNDLVTVPSVGEMPASFAQPAPKTWRTDWRGVAAMVSALAVGLLLVWGGQAFLPRIANTVSSTPKTTPTSTPTPTLPNAAIRPTSAPQQAAVAARKGPFLLADRDFATLDEAVHAAGQGSEIRIDADGPVPTMAVDCGDRSLTLRAAPGRRPCLVLAAQQGAAPWQGLLRSSAVLVLVGIDLTAEPDAKGGPLLEGTNTFRLTGCHLRAPGRPVAVALRRGAEMTLTNSQVEGGAVALSMEVGSQPCRLALSTSSIRADDDGIALSVWSAPLADPGAVRVELQGTTLDAGLLLALRGLSAGVAITARTNTFHFHRGVLDLAGQGDPWQSGLRWTGSANRYHGDGAWLQGGADHIGVASLSGWRKLLATDEAGSVEDVVGPTG